MKRTFKIMAIAFAMSITLTSCFSYTSVVGKGAQGNSQVTKWNHYVIGGLAPVGVSDSKAMKVDFLFLKVSSTLSKTAFLSTSSNI